MKDAHGAAANFLLVYLREAHACDEWEMKDNLKDGIKLFQPQGDDDRRAAAARFAAEMKLTIPVIVDGVDDAVGTRYGAWPERIYFLDAAGRVLYRGGPGPFEFRPEEVEQLLRRLPGERQTGD